MVFGTLYNTALALVHIYAPNWDDVNFFNNLFISIPNLDTHHLILGGDFNLVLDPVRDRSSNKPYPASNSPDALPAEVKRERCARPRRRFAGCTGSILLLLYPCRSNIDSTRPYPSLLGFPHTQVIHSLCVCVCVCRVHMQRTNIYRRTSNNFINHHFIYFILKIGRFLSPFLCLASSLVRSVLSSLTAALAACVKNRTDAELKRCSVRASAGAPLCSAGCATSQIG